MSTPPKPHQFDKDRRRAIPELEQTGPDETISVGSTGQTRDDLVPRYKNTMRDFLKSMQTDQLDGNKRNDSNPFADQDVLEQHDRGQFFKQARDGQTSNEIRQVLDDIIGTDLTAEEILRAIKGTPNSYIPTQGSNQGISSENFQDDPNARKIIGATNRILSNNRFSPNNPYMDNGRRRDDFAAMPKGLGTSETLDTTSFDDLRKVGMSLMLRATGEFIQGDPTRAGTALGSLLPGQAQLGIPIPARNLYAQEAFGAPGNERSRIPNVSLEGSDPYSSFGQLNSANEPFNGFLPLGMVALSTVMIIALRGLIGGLSALFSIGIPPGQKVQIDAQQRHPTLLTLGSFKESPRDKKFQSLISLRDIGIIQLDRPWNLAVNEGIKTFFDFSGTSFKRVAQSPGFYANMVRVIVQSGARLITSVIDAFRNSGNVVAGAQQLLGIMDVLKSSKIIAFMNIMAQIGDKELSRREGKYQVSLKMNAMHSNSRNTKIGPDGRGGGTYSPLSWRLTTAPATLLLPQTTIAGSGQVKNESAQDVKFQEIRSKLSHDKINDKNKGETRFSSEFVAEMEEYLESQYVPFYFHDLRTNEILSFHAFIDDVSENYAPNYNTSNPFGRVDPVMSYTNTTRTFSLNFKIVATDETDLSAMYAKLNKLTTLVYPQWTHGRAVQDSSGLKFRQPFSQVQGASPLVRIRLGDLIKTNFSNLALARLFGLGEDEILNATTQASKAENTIRTNILNVARKTAQEVGYSPGDILRLMSPIDSGMITSILTQNSQPGAALAVQGILGSSVPKETEKFEKWSKGNPEVRVISLTPDSTPDERKYIVRPTDSSVGDYNFVVSHIELDISPTQINKKTPSLAGFGGVGLPSPVDDFFDFEKGEKNSIVKSFKNTRGKGLAGFITTMNIDWNVATQYGKWATDKKGMKAPQLCGIQLQFTVIHDIQPGLDADGFNRAPLYNVWGSNPYGDE